MALKQFMATFNGKQDYQKHWISSEPVVRIIWKTPHDLGCEGQITPGIG